MRKLFPGAILGIILISSWTALALGNGWQPRASRNRTTNEPQFFECWFFPGLSWCHIPKEAPKVPPPDVPPGCCSDLCVGPCQ